MSWGTIGGKSPALRRLVCQFDVASIIDSDRLNYPKMRQRKNFARTLLVENVSAVSAMMLSIRETERSSTTHTDVRVSPFRGRVAQQHAFGDLNFWWEMETIPL